MINILVCDANDVKVTHAHRVNNCADNFDDMFVNLRGCGCFVDTVQRYLKIVPPGCSHWVTISEPASLVNGDIVCIEYVVMEANKC
jgi:hypothetical protein